MEITLIFKHRENGQVTERKVVFDGTPEECAMAEAWPSFTTTKYGRNYIRRMTSDPAQEAWEIFCHGDA